MSKKTARYEEEDEFDIKEELAMAHALARRAFGEPAPLEVLLRVAEFDALTEDPSGLEDDLREAYAIARNYAVDGKVSLIAVMDLVDAMVGDDG